MTLGEEMTRYRARKRITQAELADRAGVTVQTICNIERDTQTPSRTTEQKIRLVMEGESNGD